MKTEDKLRIKLQDPGFRAQLQVIKQKWGLNQTTYKSIRNFIKDERLCYKIGIHNPKTKTCLRYKAGNYFTMRGEKKVKLEYQDKLDFSDEVVTITNDLNLPLRIGAILIDYLVYGTLDFKHYKIGIGIERNALRGDLGRVVLYVDPDVRLADIKKEWHRVRRTQYNMQRDGKKNRSPKYMEVVFKAQKEKASKKKYRIIDVIEDSKKDLFNPKAAANARQMKYRYKKM